ncbi:transcriptional regulator [Sporosarcina pasteurii]|uniref:transcriptional regulator n=1 Tax=Sporosarcina pasteurii TaxID=1474 RepID=UPI00287C1CA0|nr:transcriptional regulator [Sporosarcina pasteurii]MDS9472180.1 transcriptional regulator [Sporosarcina pasteurii]
MLTLRAKKSMREVIVKIPKRMLNENEHTVVHQGQERGDFVYISTKRYETNHEPEAIREAMMKGYVEMSQINLKIATECLHVEFEAQHTVERLVSGG